MANINVANIKPPKAPNLPIPPNQYSQEYSNLLTNTLRLYFNQIDVLCKYVVNPDIGYYLNSGYGGFADTTTQTVATINTAQGITFDTTTIFDANLSMNGGAPDIGVNPLDTSMVVVGFPAIYNFSFSIRVTGGATGNIWVWVMMDGVAVPLSTRSTPIASGQTLIVSDTYLLEALTPSTVFQLMWATDNVAIQITPQAATAFCPAAPSATLTISSVSA